jgi:PAS domain S-box-containing protein
MSWLSTIRNRTPALSVALAAVYVATGYVGLEIAGYARSVTLVWPPAGIALAALALGGRKLWPGIALGAFVVNLSTGVTTAVALGIATGNTLGALVGVELFERIGVSTSLSRRRDVVALIAAAACFPPVSASVGVATITLGGVIPSSQALGAWLWWCVGDSVGILLIAPVLLTWRLPMPVRGRLLETLALTTLLVTTSAAIFLGGVDGHAEPLTFVVVLPLTWAASRFGSRGAALAALATATIAIAGTLAGRGPFSGYPLQQGLLYLELCVTMLSSMALLLAAEVSERERIFSHLSKALQEQARTQQELRHSEKRFRLLADHASDIIAELDAQGNILYVSPGLTASLGHSVDAIAGRRLPDVLDALIHPEDRQKLDTGFARITEDLKSTFRALYRARHANGDWRWLETRTQSFEAADGTVHAVSVHRDITERERADARFRLAVEASPAGALMIDATGRIVLVNRAAASLFGYERHELIGQSVEILVAPMVREKHPRFREDFLLSPATRAMGAGRDLYGVRKDGSEVPVEIGLNPIETDEGVFVLSSIVDITERKHAEREILDKARRLEQSNRELDQFAHVVSHDLKSPLQGIASLAGWIEEDSGEALPDASRVHLGMLVKRVKHLGALIDGILDYSRIGWVAHSLEWVDVPAMVREVIDSLMPPAGIRVELESGLPGVVHDRVQLAQMFQNLIGNAIVHIGRPCGTIVVSGMDRGDHIEYAVRDDGVGIDPRHHERIFRMFQSLRSDGGGTGIGLAVVKKIAERWGGRVWLESKPGEGATFRFTVPKRESLV